MTDEWECECSPEFLEQEDFPLELSVKCHIELGIDRKTGDVVSVSVSGTNQGDPYPEAYMMRCYECGTWFDDFPSVDGEVMARLMEKTLEDFFGVKRDD